MSTYNIGFYEDLTKIIFKLSSNTHLISSSVTKISRMFVGFYFVYVGIHVVLWLTFELRHEKTFFHLLKQRSRLVGW